MSAPTPAREERRDVSRRRFLGYLVAAPTLVVAAEFGRQQLFAPPGASAAAIPSPPQVADVYDLCDAIRDSARPTANLVKVEVNRDGTVSFALPRSDNGQGIITSTAMIIAEEMDLDPDQVIVTLADSRPELVFNQLTGGSSTTFSTFTPVRVAAAIAKGALLDAAGHILGQDVDTLTSRSGLITGAGGSAIPFSELTEAAASDVTKEVQVALKPREEFRILGTDRGKSDARAIVTGKKKFLADMKVPDALPTVICRGPNLNSAPQGVENADEVRNMPGITDVVMVNSGVAVRARTTGQAIDGVNALRVQWDGGTVEGENDESVLEQVRAAELPLAVPSVPGETVEGDFTFYFRSNSALETNLAIADVRDGSAEIWSALKIPITVQHDIAEQLGMPVNAVTLHVAEGGGSFGRRLFGDAAKEAAEVSQKLGKPVSLIWTRSDDSRQGRVHPLATSRVRAVVSGDSVVSYEQRHTSVTTDFGHGFGDAVTAAAGKAPLGAVGLSEAIWELTQNTPYDFGAQTRTLSEVDLRFNTSSMRNVYSPDVCTARDLIVDRIAEKMGKDSYEFRREFLRNDDMRAVLDKVVEEGNWGRSMPEGTAQGLGFHVEYKSFAACLVEIDCRPETVNRKVRSARTGPRVTKVVFASDSGLILNPLGYKAQVMGGINDGLAMTLTSGLHLDDGHFVEASWDNYFYTRQWNTPLEMEIFIVDNGRPEPGGVGELAVAPTCGAVANAYARATGKVPEYFPIMHKEPLPFEPYPTVPPVPPSPTDGLELAR
ncbi:molybdopterin cofactor-binding domain-containing protein [Pseudonocardia parietis]|uniref:Isoquinoline 1-oxidoreductase beta subunit n=1 Tax=Pseudonocardia parietis TaxID=570936 RepID=A0ABS4VLJ9_9PSEU|nr:molybdopterin cofactor-binding domain-containing protein [Pseudonocardia parietis]MBP2364479.1 isoquinoline 1-oxidoreductase beta subunit [Pseudonocardia parietis]